METKAPRIDRETFGSVVRQYGKALFNAAYRIVNDPEEAMDITQTAFIKAYERIDRYDPSHDVFSWLYKITIHEAINAARRRSRLVPLDENIGAPGGPDDECAQNETSRRLQAALMALSLDYRTVIVLRHFQNLSYREMAAILDVPEKTVKSRLFSGRRLLRDSLLKMGYAP